MFLTFLSSLSCSARDLTFAWIYTTDARRVFLTQETAMFASSLFHRWKTAILQNSLTLLKKQLLLERKKKVGFLFSCSQDSIRAMSFLCGEKHFSCHFRACICQTIHTNFIHRYIQCPSLSSFSLLEHASPLQLVSH